MKYNGVHLYHKEQEINTKKVKVKNMKNTINIKVNNEKEYNEYIEMLKSRGFEQIGTRLFEDNQSYVRISIA